MNLKSFIVTFTTFVGTTFLLYMIGHLFTITWLMFHFHLTNTQSEFSFESGSFTPLILGLIASFFAEQLYLHKTVTKP